MHWSRWRGSNPHLLVRSEWYYPLYYSELAGPERIELPPPGSKPGMISISPKADVKNPAVCVNFNEWLTHRGQSRVVWRKITESNCHRCQWTGFQVQLASKASIFQNCGAGRENRTLTLTLARS